LADLNPMPEKLTVSSNWIFTQDALDVFCIHLFQASVPELNKLWGYSLPVPPPPLIEYWAITLALT
jgi:hypothetical protein